MPNKTCPDCSAQHGVRKLKCDCGFEFKTSTRSKVDSWIGMGAWINDTPKDMPKVDIPDDLPNTPDKITTKDISHNIAYEGIGFCVYHYIASHRIKDKKLSKLWQEARQKLVEVITYVTEHEQED